VRQVKGRKGGGIGSSGKKRQVSRSLQKEEYIIIRIGKGTGAKAAKKGKKRRTPGLGTSHVNTSLKFKKMRKGALSRTVGGQGIRQINAWGDSKQTFDL